VPTPNNSEGNVREYASPTDRYSTLRFAVPALISASIYYYT